MREEEGRTKRDISTERKKEGRREEALHTLVKKRTKLEQEIGIFATGLFTLQVRELCINIAVAGAIPFCGSSHLYYAEFKFQEGVP